MVFMFCNECGQTLLVAVGIEEWHCLNALCKSNASGMNSSLQRILKNASGMKEPFLPPLETELEDILEEGDGLGGVGWDRCVNDWVGALSTIHKEHFQVIYIFFF